MSFKFQLRDRVIRTVSLENRGWVGMRCSFPPMVHKKMCVGGVGGHFNHRKILNKNVRVGPLTLFPGASLTNGLGLDGHCVRFISHQRKSYICNFVMYLMILLALFWATATLISRTCMLITFKTMPYMICRQWSNILLSCDCTQCGCFTAGYLGSGLPPKIPIQIRMRVRGGL